MIIQIALLPIHSDKMEELKPLLDEFIGATQQEDGVHLCLPTTMLHETCTIVLIEEYASEAVFRAHCQQDYSRQLLFLLPDFLADQPEFRHYTVSKMAVQHQP